MWGVPRAGLINPLVMRISGTCRKTFLFSMHYENYNELKNGCFVVCFVVVVVFVINIVVVVLIVVAVMVHKSLLKLLLLLMLSLLLLLTLLLLILLLWLYLLFLITSYLAVVNNCASGPPKWYQ